MNSARRIGAFSPHITTAERAAVRRALAHTQGVEPDDLCPECFEPLPDDHADWHTAPDGADVHAWCCPICNQETA